MSWGERTVEVPWFLSKVNTNGSTLDIGAAESCYINELLDIGVPRLVLSDIRDFSTHEQDSRVKCIVGDSRNVSIKKMGGPFDTVLCISTLEHVALDAYDQHKDHTGHPYDAQLDALRKMMNFLDRDGQFILTVPYGKYEHGGWVIVYNEKMLDRIRNEYYVEEETFFTLIDRDNDTWIECEQEQCPQKGMDHYKGHMRATSCACLVLKHQ